MNKLKILLLSAVLGASAIMIVPQQAGAFSVNCFLLENKVERYGKELERREVALNNAIYLSAESFNMKQYKDKNTQKKKELYDSYLEKYNNAVKEYNSDCNVNIPSEGDSSKNSNNESSTGSREDCKFEQDTIRDTIDAILSGITKDGYDGFEAGKEIGKVSAEVTVGGQNELENTFQSVGKCESN